MDKTTTPIDPVIRTAMAEAVKVHGLRVMSREVAMSASGLKKFIDGAESYRPARRRLEAWYSGWGTEQPFRVRDEAVAQLVKTFPQPKQEEVRRALTELLAAHSAPRPRRRRRRR